MDQATKAALLSALLFPGWGQMYLKAYVRGVVFMIPALAGSALLAYSVILAGFGALPSVARQKDLSFMEAVVSLMLQAFQTINYRMFFPLLALLLILWALSIIDAYQLGKKIMMPATDADR